MATILQIGLENAGTATALAILAGVLGLTLKSRPALRHCLFLLVLLKLVTPPLWRVPVLSARDLPARVLIKSVNLAPIDRLVCEADGFDPRAFEQPADPLPDVFEISTDFVPVAPMVVPEASAWTPAFPFSILELLEILWIGGSALCLVLAIERIRRFRKVLGLVKPAPDEVEDLVSEVADRLDLGQRPRVGMVSGTISPMVWCLGLRPFLILPAELWGRLDDSQRRTLLAHELAHLKRGDHWVRLFELAVTVTFWWLPVVWWVRKALREAEEQCCDAWVVWAFPEASRAYAETLVETVDFLSGDRSPVPAFASGIGRIHHLKRRLCMIMKGTTPHTLGFGGTLAALTISALLLPLSPTMAQKAEDKKEEQKIEVIVKHADEAAAADIVKRVIVNHADKAKGADQSKSVIFIPDGGPQGLVTVLRDTQDGENKINVIVKTSDDEDGKTKKNEQNFSFTTTASSADGDASGAMKQAVERLEKKVAELKSKKEKGPQDETIIKTLTEAIKSLESENLSRSVSPRPQIFMKRAVSASSADNKQESEENAKKLSAEDRTNRDQLMAEMQKLHAEAQRSQVDLCKAQANLTMTHKRLAELNRKLAGTQFQGMDVKGNIRFTELMQERLYLTPENTEPSMPPVPPTPAAVMAPRTYRVTPAPARAGASNSDQDKRIDALEKKLDRILDRLDSQKNKD